MGLGPVCRPSGCAQARAQGTARPSLRRDAVLAAGGVTLAIAFGVAVLVPILATHCGRHLSRSVPSEDPKRNGPGLTLVIAALTLKRKVSAGMGSVTIGIALSGESAESAHRSPTPLRDRYAALFFAFFGLDYTCLPATPGTRARPGRHHRLDEEGRRIPCCQACRLRPAWLRPPGVNARRPGTLPLPITHVIDGAGGIRGACVDADCTPRADPADNLAALDALDWARNAWKQRLTAGHRHRDEPMVGRHPPPIPDPPRAVGPDRRQTWTGSAAPNDTSKLSHERPRPPTRLEGSEQTQKRRSRKRRQQQQEAEAENGN